MRSHISCGISRNFSRLFPTKGQITHALLTRPPLSTDQLPAETFRRSSSARLACVRHAASVHPEPGSNSLIKFILNQYLAYLLLTISKQLIPLISKQLMLFTGLFRSIFIQLALMWFTSTRISPSFNKSLSWIKFTWITPNFLNSLPANAIRRLWTIPPND